MKERIEKARHLLDEVKEELDFIDRLKDIPEYLKSSPADFRDVYQDMYSFLHYIMNQNEVFTNLNIPRYKETMPDIFEKVLEDSFKVVGEGLDRFNILVDKMKNNINTFLMCLSEDRDSVKLMLLKREIEKSNLPVGSCLIPNTIEWFKAKIMTSTYFLTEKDMRDREVVKEFTDLFKSLV